MFRNKSWFGSGWGRPKNPHSLERLKYLHNVLCKNTTVSESNRGTLVESLRCIAEILIWGDQNDSSVFDFFLEKSMLSYFLKIMRQKCGGSSYVCVQLLQTLNILFENIRNETSLYYLLSNNHVNSIIVHKFDFSDEEVMAYYISFLKTLSLKLNSHTIHFFYNENTKDFPLYTEAIKFFNHPEGMVRIAVRTLTLNVYRVRDPGMLRFIRDRTAAPYFSNLVWFIGKHILELDTCVRNDAGHNSQQKLDDLVAEHLDHLHYINDILCLDIPDLNEVLTEHLLHKLLVPLYIYSLTAAAARGSAGRDQMEALTRGLDAILKGKRDTSPARLNYPRRRTDAEDERPSVSCVVALFLLSQVFLIITHGPIVHALAWIIVQSDYAVFEEGATRILERHVSATKAVKLEFSEPQLSLEMALESSAQHSRDYTTPEFNGPRRFDADADADCDDPELVGASLPGTSRCSVASAEEPRRRLHSNLPDSPLPDSVIESKLRAASTLSNITDEEKEKLLNNAASAQPEAASFESVKERQYRNLDRRPFLKTVINSLDCSENDYKALFALCLLYALINNKGVNSDLLDTLLVPETGSRRRAEPQAGGGATPDAATSGGDATPAPPAPPADPPLSSFNELLVSKLMTIANNSCNPSSKVRLVTLEISLCLIVAAARAAGGAAGGAAGCAAGGAAGGAGAAHSRLLAQADVLRQRAAALARNFYIRDDIFLDMFEDEYCETSKKPVNVEWLCMDAAVLLPPAATPLSGIAFGKRLPSGEMERARRAIRTFFLVRDMYLKVTGKSETQLPLANPRSFFQTGERLDLNGQDLISCNIHLADGAWQHRFLTVDSVQVILVEPDRQHLGWGIAKLVGSLQDLEIVGDKDDPRCLHLTIYKPRAGAAGLAPRAVLLRAKFKFDDYIRSMAVKQRLNKGRTKTRQKKIQQIGRLLEIPGMAAPEPTARRAYFADGRLFPGRPSEVDDGERKLRRPSGHRIVICRERTASRDSSHSRGSSGHGSREGSPRARPEHIPLEDIRQRAPELPPPPPPAPSGSAVDHPIPKVMSTSSEETSFISGEPPRAKRKGVVETI